MVIGDGFPIILMSARRGEGHAVEVLYRDLAPSVLGYLRAQRATNPEDVASEVFVSMVRGLGGFTGDEPAFRAWVFTIAHRRFVDERRRAVRTHEAPEEPDRLAALASVRRTGNAEDEALAELSGQAALRALDRLTEDQRAVVLLRVLVDLPIRDVAHVLGKREGAIKALQQRALSRLAGEEFSREAVSS